MCSSDLHGRSARVLPTAHRGRAEACYGRRAARHAARVQPAITRPSSRVIRWGASAPSAPYEIPNVNHSTEEERARPDHPLLSERLSVGRVRRNDGLQSRAGIAVLHGGGKILIPAMQPRPQCHGSASRRLTSSKCDHSYRLAFVKLMKKLQRKITGKRTPRQPPKATLITSRNDERRISRQA